MDVLSDQPLAALQAWLRAHPAVGRDVAIAIFGRFSRADVAVDWVEDGRAARAIDEAAEAVWQRRLAVARQAGQVLYPGPLCRLDRAEVEGGKLHLVLSPTDYREFVGTNLALPGLAAGGSRRADGVEPGRLADPLGVAIALATADGRLLVFRRSRRLAEYPGRLHVVGGHVEPTDRDAAGRIDPFLAAEREIGEEVGVRAEDLEDVWCLGLAWALPTHKPELVFGGRLRLDAPALVVRFARQPGPEHDELILVEAKAEAVLDFLSRRRGEIVPAARACLAMSACSPRTQLQQRHASAGDDATSPRSTRGRARGEQTSSRQKSASAGLRRGRHRQE